MRATISALLTCVLAIVVGYGAGIAQTTPYQMAPGETLQFACESGLSGTLGTQTATLICATLVPTATATATLTPTVAATHTHTPTPAGHPTGWHPAGVGGHEHGDAPPQWVLDHSMKPFTQSRESHVGYKGALATDRGGKGVESYLIAHILATSAARSHGDHDYQVWFRHPDGTVLASQGVLDFSSVAGNPTGPILLRTVDTGERPIALAERSQTDSFETWYSRPGVQVFDLGWSMGRRYQRFDGTVIGGNGSIRTIDWVLVADRLPQGHPLRQNCTVEFNVCRHSFLINTRDYFAPGVVPIN